ncbi:MAG: anaerobic ribonucleoside-triphosphate reductase activating protein [Microbacterium arborescens]
MPGHAGSDCYDDLRIAGLSRFSSVDWPGRLVATAFLQGCPWDSGYCHNPKLIDPRRSPARFRGGRSSSCWTIGTACSTASCSRGGEPTMQRGLRAAAVRVRELGYDVGLHTGGAFPALLEPVLAEVSWIGLDVKAAPDGYAAVTRRAPSGRAALRSLDLVLAEQRAAPETSRPLEVEVRTTVHPDLIDDATLGDLGRFLADRGVRRWAVQRFRPAGTRCGAASAAPLRLDGCRPSGSRASSCAERDGRSGLEPSPSSENHARLGPMRAIGPSLAAFSDDGAGSAHAAGGEGVAEVVGVLSGPGR